MPNGGGGGGRGGGTKREDGSKKGPSINDGGGGGEEGNNGVMKKGPWTESEDAILREYVTKHGEGNWNGVRRKTGLMRCGKSCRLRWANHLKPDLKKVPFSPQEEFIIMDLHSKLGNKWARMATQLPGRTDNEIKNFWNTRMKRRHRAGFPKHVNKDRTLNRDGVSWSNNPRTPNYNSIPPLSLSTPPPPPTSPFFQMNQSNHHQLKFLPPNSLFGAPTTPTWFDPNLPFEATTPSLIQYGSNHDMSYSSMVMGAIAEPEGLPSIQTPPPLLPPPSHPVSSKADRGDCATANFSYNINSFGIETSGLLDALVQESLSKYSRKIESPFPRSAKSNNKPVVVIDGEDEDQDEDLNEKAANNRNFKLASSGDGVEGASCDNGILHPWNNTSTSHSLGGEY